MSADNIRVRVQAMVDPATAEKLKEVASKDRRTLSDYLRIVIEEHLENK